MFLRGIVKNAIDSFVLKTIVTLSTKRPLLGISDNDLLFIQFKEKFSND
jgi:hypothetical protein